MVIYMKRVEKRSGKPSSRGRRKSKDDGYRKKRVKAKTTVVDVEVHDPASFNCLPNIQESLNARSDTHSDSASANSDIYAGVRTLEELRRIRAAGRFPDAPEVDEKTGQVMAFLRGKEESLRWEFKMEDPELEEIRLRLYKLNRRKRYMAHAQKMGYSWGNTSLIGGTGYGSNSDGNCTSSRDSSAAENASSCNKVGLNSSPSNCLTSNGSDSTARSVGPYARKEELQHYMSMKEAMNHGYPMRRSLLQCNYS